MQPFTFLLIVTCTFLAGYADAQGFIHSTTIWHGGSFQWPAAVRSALAFSLSIPCYWLAIRYVQESGVLAPELQAGAWFVVTIVGIALVGGTFLTWRSADQAVGLLVVAGVVWLIVRTGG